MPWAPRGSLQQRLNAHEDGSYELLEGQNCQYMVSDACIRPYIGRSHLQVGSVKVGSSHSAPKRLPEALYSQWERYGSLMGDFPLTKYPPAKGFELLQDPRSPSTINVGRKLFYRLSR